MPALLDLLGSGLDAIALAYFLLVVVGYKLLTEHGLFAERSIVAAVQRHRIGWMRNMALRENRMLDGVILGGLGQGNAFFASTSAIAIGGLLAIVGSGEKAQAFIERLPYATRASPALWEIKLLLILAIFAYAFFKFAWSFRLSHYTAIMIGATPIMSEDTSAACEAHAEHCARLIGIAANHTNAGMRAFYYVIAALAWFFHPLAFMAATSWIMLIMLRRDFYSRARRALRAEPTVEPPAPDAR